MSDLRRRRIADRATRQQAGAHARNEDSQVQKEKTMKYLILSEHDLPVAVLFDELLNHREVAGQKKVLGAGYCNRTGQVWGQSVSLGIKAKKEDELIILKSLHRRS